VAPQRFKGQPQFTIKFRKTPSPRFIPRLEHDYNVSYIVEESPHHQFNTHSKLVGGIPICFIVYGDVEHQDGRVFRMQLSARI
jgi:hypothetical protein